MLDNLVLRLDIMYHDKYPNSSEAGYHGLVWCNMLVDVRWGMKSHKSTKIFYERPNDSYYKFLDYLFYLIIQLCHHIDIMTVHGWQGQL